ncbi:glycosyltransferase [Microbacterium sp. ET2]|uniref:glycosyltransferase family 2 protein n=1 Tax=Microbacterium albipurpureum TaxID=3050384 RepID=UPI00259C9813|nr:glycosyltransferase [Microbacterium sp. ET2 (Ac-2212)]WJL94732.1 glycosyltransferase [Microbacterium sp. ET2 (Ac-2212)]
MAAPRHHAARDELVVEAASVALVICTRDRPELLRDALVAARAAAGDAEIVVVDSASRDPRTREVADAAGVRYVRSDVPGLSIARNLGLRSTAREIVVFTDDDCALASDALAPLVAPFADVAVGATTGHLRDHTATSAAPTGPAVTLERVTEGLDAGHGALMAFRRSLAVELGGFDPVLGAGRRFGGAEDMDMLCRVLRAGSRVVRVPQAVVTHVFTRGDDDYVRLNENYGLGIGAMCAKWLTLDRSAGRAVTAVVVRRALTRLARRLRSARARTGQVAYLRGLRRGFSEGRRLAVDGQVFTDTNPPAEVPLSTEGVIG